MVWRSRTVAAFALITALALGVASNVAHGRPSDAPAAVSTVTLVSGPVVITHAGGDTTPAREGDLVSAGDTVRAAEDGAAEITYAEGTSVRVEGAGEVVIAKLVDESGGGVMSRVSWSVDRTWQVVTKLVTGSTRYDVRSPSATASVRG